MDVSKQSVAEGKTVDEGTTVTLTVNKVAENKTITISVNVKGYYWRVYRNNRES